MNRKEKGILASTITALLCSMVANVPQTHATDYTVIFTTGDILIENIFTVRLTLGISVKTSMPIFFFSGESGRMTIDVSPDTTSISVIFQGNTYTKTVATPIGSVKIPIYDVFGLGSLYVKITGSIETTIETERAYGSPNTLSWDVETSKDVLITHTGSGFWFDSVKIRIPLTYTVSLAVGIETLGTPLYEYSREVGDLIGVPIITESISTLPMLLMPRLIIPIGIIVLIMVTLVVIAKRRARKRSQV